MAEKENTELEENFAEMLATSEEANRPLRSGQKVKGKVIAVNGDDVFVDIGVKEDGVMGRKDLGDKEPEIGDEIEAFITGISSQGIKLSRYMEGASVAALEEAKENGIPVEGKIRNVCKGGFQVEVMGKTAFCPGSQMALNAPAEELVGKTYPFAVTRVENNGRNIVVSRRALIEKEQKENLDKLLEAVKPGDIVEGKITRVAPFGVFIELAPGVEGLAHISQLSWSRVEKPEELYSPGDVVKAKFLSHETDEKGRSRLSLSVRQALGDPWEDIDAGFKVGEIVEGTVVRLTPFGAFITIADGVDGLAHVSELSWDKKVRNPADALTVGDKVRVKIKDINKDDKKISLSVRDAEADPWADVEQRFKVGETYKGSVESRSPHGLFVNLAPGVDGLLPASVIRELKDNAKYSRLQAGDEINVVIQKVDCGAKRISLNVENSSKPSEDQSWRGHAKSGSSGSSFASGVMAEALSRAFNKQKKGE